MPENSDEDRKKIYREKLKQNLKHQYVCGDCAKEKLKDWKGFPKKDEVPRLPVIRDGECINCGGANKNHRKNFVYLNVHGLGNTGLPDYFVIIYCKRRDNEYENLRRFGLPYAGPKNIDTGEQKS